MGRTAAALMVLIAVAACDLGRRQTIEDSIPGIPVWSQRQIIRSNFGWQWPLLVGRGTLGCESQAVVFRTGGVTYAVNASARARGFASIDPIRAIEQGALPSNPLSRLPQDERMQVFGGAVACDELGGAEASVSCRQRLRELHRLSQPELEQIEYEGRERRWPPISRAYRTLEPLIEMGSRLCSQ